MLRISTTTLESFRLWSQPDQDWMPESELIASIKGEFVPTPRVRLGKAFGKVLETPEAYRVSGGFRCDDFDFGDDVMQPALALCDRRGCFEVKSTRAYDGHTVVAMVDQIIGARVVETKTTLGTFDLDKYAKGCQWRFYADIFQALVVTYHVFELSEATNGAIDLRNVHSFNLFPYTDLHQDCLELVRAFVAYVEQRGLQPYLLPTGEAAA